VTNRVSADFWPPGGWPKLDVCQAVVKDEVMCTSFLVMGTARTRLNEAGRTWVPFPVNAAIKPRILQLRSQLFQLAVLIAVDRHQAVLVETHTPVRRL
jgi:nitrate reductase gamma subunit